MPVPSTFDDLSETASSNSPAGSETVGTQANEYLQSAFSFIRRLYDGALKPLAAVDVNGQKITNGAPGTLSTTSTDFVTGSQMYRIGEQRIWHGAVANIADVWGDGWQLADGTNGTLDMRNRMMIGAGDTYAPGDTGGAASVILTTAQLPAHNHPVTDNGHTHGTTDPGHTHIDAGHQHQQNGLTLYNVPGSGISGSTLVTGGTAALNTGTGQAQLGNSFTGLSIKSSTTGISTGNTGMGNAVPTLPPYVGVLIIEYTGLTS